MAVDRNRLAAALAYEEERRRRLAETIPTVGPVQAAPPSRNLRRDLENLSIGIGEGLVNQLEGVKGIVTDPIGSVKGAYETVKGVVRDPSVLADALRYTAQKASSGPLGAGEVVGEFLTPGFRGARKPPMAEIDVYHGSPHRFEEFDASKIGTGEGAQAYGHGIYLAESPDVAKTYKAANDPIARKAEELLRSTDGNVDRAMRYAKKKVEDLEKNRDVKGFFSPVALEQNQGALDYLRQVKKGKTPKVGTMYTADLPDEMVDRMLDWDKRISDQPEFVQKAWADWRNSPQAKKLVNQMTARGSSAQDIEKMFGNPTGEAMHKWIYEGYGSAKGGEMPKVAQFLKDRGLLGVKYQDAGSRGQGGSGTRNFVVFPGEEKKVKILKRE